MQLIKTIMKTHRRNQNPGADSITKELCHVSGRTDRPPLQDGGKRAVHRHGRSTRKTRGPIPSTLNARFCETYEWQIYHFEFISERLFPAGSSTSQKRSTWPQTSSAKRSLVPRESSGGADPQRGGDGAARAAWARAAPEDESPPPAWTLASPPNTTATVAMATTRGFR